MRKDTYLYQRIVDDIRELIESGKLKPHDKIYSVNEIRKKYQVSHITALRAYKDLTSAHFINFIRGKGYFVNGREQFGKGSLHKAVALLIRPMRHDSPYDNLFNEITVGLHRKCLERQFDVYYPKCNQFLLDYLPTAEGCREILKTIEKLQNNVDGFVIDERVPDAILKKIPEISSKPFVIVNRDSELPIDSVHPDNAQGGRDAALFSLKMGYTHFILCHMPRDRNAMQRFEAFRDTLLQKQIPEGCLFRVDECSVRHSEVIFQEMLNKIRENNCANKSRTLIFTTRDGFARGLCEFLQEQELKIGQEVGIFGFDGMGYATVKEPQLTSMKIDNELIGRTAIKVLLEQLNGGSTTPGFHPVPVTLMLGETV
jgi:GntR family transcriptional regulator, arabinose operon transcriptional repressor